MDTAAPDSLRSATTRTGTRPAWIVALLCWLIVVFDGYDLIVFGTTLTRVMDEPGWDLSATGAGYIGSLAFLGMLIGALAAGGLADRLGRRRTILACTLWFSVFTALCAVAPTPEVFGLLRFLAGLGLGGLVPSANALTAEFVRPRNRSMVATIMMSGVPLGGTAAALLGLWMLPELGWRAMYAVAVLAVVVLLPLCLALLPESATWLRAQGRHGEAAEVERRYRLPGGAEETGAERGERAGVVALFRAPWALLTTLYALATVVTLFAWYGLGTWLPGLMESDDRFDMGSPLSFLLALNLGAVAGSFITAGAGVRFGPLRSATAAAAAAGLGLLFLLTYPTSVTPIYAALVLAGVGTHGTQCLIIAAIATQYPPRLRGSSLGFALGAGRIGAVTAPIVGGWLLDAGFGVGGNFLAFAVAAGAAAALLIAIIVVSPATSRPDATGDGESTPFAGATTPSIGATSRRTS